MISRLRDRRGTLFPCLLEFEEDSWKVPTSPRSTYCEVLLPGVLRFRSHKHKVHNPKSRPIGGIVE